MQSSTAHMRLGGVAEVAAELGISRQQLSKLRARADFPPPLGEISAGPVWDLSLIARWNSSGARRPPGRPRQAEELFLFGGRFKTEDLIGHGGFADVFRAIDLQGEPQTSVVAVKVLRAVGDQEGKARFLRELKVASALSHPNIIPILALGETAAGQPWYAMPMAAGSLVESVDEFTGNEARIVDLMKQLCLGLQYLHERGILHRDLKPGNVLRLRSGSWAISDFGLARVTESESPPLTSTHREGLGTHIYTAPEQWLDATKAVIASDIFGLGKILQELTTGTLPITSDISDVPFRRVIQKATRTNHERRHQSAVELLNDLLRETSVLAKWETSGEALEGLALRVSRDPPDIDALHDLIRLAARHETDPEIIGDLDTVVPLIPSSGLAAIWKEDADGLRDLINRLAQHVGGTTYEWGFCDTLADFFERVVMISRDAEITAASLVGLMKLGERHDRWRVRGAIVSILQAIQQHTHALAALDRLDECEPSTLSWALQGFTIRTLHPTLRAGLLGDTTNSDYTNPEAYLKDHQGEGDGSRNGAARDEGK